MTASYISHILHVLHNCCSHYLIDLVSSFIQKLTVYIGEPIDLSSVLDQYRNHRSDWLSGNAVVVRKHITDVIQEKLRELKTCTQELHDSWNCTSKVAYRLL